jgi:DNA-directed RNA polymerase specialized sigma24 family protein
MNATPTTTLPFHVILNDLRLNAEAAWCELNERFFARLIALARSRLFDKRLRPRLDPEEVVQSVFRMILENRVLDRVNLDSWDALWALLCVMTINRTRNKVRGELTAKRNPDCEERPPQTGCAALEDEQVRREPIDRQPTPAEQAELEDEIRKHLGALPETSRRIIELGLGGYGDEEIHEETGAAVHRVRLILREFIQDLMAEAEWSGKS